MRITIEKGDIADARGYDAWVNTENVTLEMARLVERSVSSRIRRLGALWSDAENRAGDLLHDTIRHDLRAQVGFERPEIGTIYETTPGELRAAPHHLRRLYHVIMVDERQKAHAQDVGPAMANLLSRVEADNHRLLHKWGAGQVRRLLTPLFGTGNGGLSVPFVAQTMIEAALAFRDANRGAVLCEIGFCAFTDYDAREAERILLLLGGAPEAAQ